MHSFGVPRWGDGLLDDIRSVNDNNKRVAGEFTKSVRVKGIIQRMYEKLTTSPDWMAHFERLVKSQNGLLGNLQKGVGKMASDNFKFNRERLQTRFFELGYVLLDFTGLLLPLPPAWICTFL
jgi:hypothetical protein